METFLIPGHHPSTRYPPEDQIGQRPMHNSGEPLLPNDPALEADEGIEEETDA
ncbi:MAG: hypothetical protein ACK2UP_09055 [Candidatus Promineifilaceae bacterium]